MATLTTGVLERDFGVPAQVARRLEAALEIPQATRAGTVRFWKPEDLPAILEAARRRGYAVRDTEQATA